MPLSFTHSKLVFPSARSVRFSSVVFVGVSSLCLLLLLSVLILFQPVTAGANTIPWWSLSYGYRQQLTVTNNSAAILPSGYSVHLSLGHFSLVEAGKSVPNGNDVRIVYWNGSANLELDRAGESSWNSPGSGTQIWFRTQADIAESGTDDNYFVYYGNLSAPSPPANRKNIYDFFDDFSGDDAGQYDTSIPGSTDIIRDGGAGVWKVQSGTWNIETDTQADGTVGKVLSHDSATGSYTYAYVLDRSYDNVLVQVKMRTKEGEPSAYWPFGARLNTSTGANYTAWSYFSYSKMLRFSGWYSPLEMAVGTTHASMGNSWHTFRFTLDGKKLNLYFDGTSYGCYVEDTTLTSGAVFVSGYPTKKIHFDDFTVRKYTTDEPTVATGAEESASARPVVTLDRKWHLKGDAHTPTDQFLNFTVNFPEADGMPGAQASYNIPEVSLSGPLWKTGSTSWEGHVNISGLPTGTFHLVVTVADTVQQCVSNALVFYVSYPFYHAWTIDWEGAYVPRTPYWDSLAIIADAHSMPMTQFFNPRVYIQYGVSEEQKSDVTQWILGRKLTKGDEIGLHLHMYFDYVQSAGLTPITSPQWGNRSDGYDVPFADYDYQQSRALLNFAIELFQQRGLGRPSSFRAGGWFADEENLRALSDLGFLDDASGSLYEEMGTLPLPWDLSETVQPYHPCSEDQNAPGCPPGSWNLPLLEIPDNLCSTAGDVDVRPYFDRNYSGVPLDSVRVGVLLSHASSAVGIEGWRLEQYFAHVDSFLYVADRGAVVNATLADVNDAISGFPPDSPDLLGPPDLVSGQHIPQCNEAFAFRGQNQHSPGPVRYRIQISQTPDYDYAGIVVDYVSEMMPQGMFGFMVGQSSSSGTYIRGSQGQILSQGDYYWRVVTIDSHGTYSNWSLADNGSLAFTVDEGTTDVESQPEANPPVPLAISFCNPSGQNVFLKAQVPDAGKALLRIFNCSGELLRTIQLEGLRAGASGLYWDGRDAEGRLLSSGVYLVELSQNSRAVTKKLVLIK